MKLLKRLLGLCERYSGRWPSLALFVKLDHLPLYRLEQIASRDEVMLSRSTMAQWVGRIGVALQPGVPLFSVPKVTVDPCPESKHGRGL